MSSSPKPGGGRGGSGLLASNYKAQHMASRGQSCHSHGHHEQAAAGAHHGSDHAGQGGVDHRQHRHADADGHNVCVCLCVQLMALTKKKMFCGGNSEKVSILKKKRN